MLRLVRAYSQGNYRDVPESTLVVIIAATIYVVNPLDVIPDALPALGFLDDATVLALAVRLHRHVEFHDLARLSRPGALRWQSAEVVRRQSGAEGYGMMLQAQTTI